jgi:hypothetical protein
MFTQEFPLPDVLRLWDTIFSEVYAEPCLSHMQTFLSKLMNSESNSGIVDFLVQFSCAMLLCVREDIINGDFGENMLLLQHYSVDMDTVFQRLREIREPAKRRSMKPAELFQKIKRTSLKYKISNPFDSSIDMLKELGLNSLSSSQEIQRPLSTPLEDIKKNSYVLGSQDEVISLN